jgi:hypothetical protein
MIKKHQKITDKWKNWLYQSELSLIYKEFLISNGQRMKNKKDMNRPKKKKKKDNRPQAYEEAI